jgi:mRNA interferase MazF
VDTIKRGDIWLVDLGLAQKTRPAVILSVPIEDHERALVTYVPRTTSLRHSRFEVEHRANGFLSGAFDIQSIGTVPTARFIRKITVLDPLTLAKVEDAVRLWLAL